MAGESSRSPKALASRTLGTLVLRRLSSDRLSNFGRAWIALHPDEAKPALLLAQHVGCTERHANLVIRGDRKPNTQIALAVYAKIIS